MPQKNHPVVDKYNLRTYYSKYDSQHCAISTKEIKIGAPIANVARLEQRSKK